MIEHGSPRQVGDVGEVGTLLERCASLVTAMAKLPAVPTPDWCDQAAQTLLEIAPSSVPAVCIFRIDGTGRVLQFAGAGVAETAECEDAGERVNKFRILLEQVATQRCDTRMAAGAGSESGKSAEVSAMSGILLPRDLREGKAPWAKCFEHVTNVGSDVCGAIWSTASLTPADRSVGLLAVLLPRSGEDLTEQNRVLLQTGANVLAKMAFHAIHATARSGQSVRVGEVQWLTPRERDVLELLVEGMSVREISDELTRSPHTVHDYVKSLYRKLGASSRGELVALALGHVRNGSRQPQA